MSRASKAEHPRWSLTTIIAFLLAGPIVWGLHFLFVYGGHTLMCVLGWSSEPQVIRAAVIAAGGAALALLVFLARAARRWRRYVVEGGGGSAASAEFQMYATLLLILLSTAGVAWSSLAAFFIAPCQTLR
ncbi:hypothetical protein [Methylocystis hirsuta]|uniref:Uncharacterized protein n=1 Tax=Methylocystis hirsuta TaxID=369798 RepID=A0A3M9XV25_9HYPH|nr:hypothetical protein [Methylocystis hirsuta]RNJ50740.1 hypothetical protein D1O30_15245 [Methylocystis hirsuta]